MNLLFLPNPSKKGNTILVGVLEHFLFFHILGIIIPTDFHIFQMGRSTNNQNLFVPQKAPFRKHPSIAFHILGERFGADISDPRIGLYVCQGLRPTIKLKGTDHPVLSELIPLMQRAWDQDPELRPDFSELEEDLKRLWSTLGP